MGTVCRDKSSSSSMVNFSLLIKEASITQLWELDVLGKSDRVESKRKEEQALAAKQLFQQTVKINEEGRIYQVDVILQKIDCKALLLSWKRTNLSKSMSRFLLSGWMKE